MESGPSPYLSSSFVQLTSGIAVDLSFRIVSQVVCHLDTNQEHFGTALRISS